jgi:hypothetical protein
LKDGSFKSSLNALEQGVITEELENDAIAWLRNIPGRNVPCKYHTG